MRECYIKSHENTDYITEAFIFSACASYDVPDLFIFSPDRGGVRGIKLQDQLQDRRGQK